MARKKRLPDENGVFKPLKVRRTKIRVTPQAASFALLVRRVDQLQDLVDAMARQISLTGYQGISIDKPPITERASERKAAGLYWKQRRADCKLKQKEAAALIGEIDGKLVTVTKLSHLEDGICTIWPPIAARLEEVYSAIDKRADKPIDTEAKEPVKASNEPLTISEVARRAGVSTPDDEGAVRTYGTKEIKRIPLTGTPIVVEEQGRTVAFNHIPDPEEPTQRSWSLEMPRLLLLANEGKVQTAADEFKKLAPNWVQPESEDGIPYKRWDLDRRVKYLDKHYPLYIQYDSPLTEAASDGEEW